MYKNINTKLCEVIFL